MEIVINGEITQLEKIITRIMKLLTISLLFISLIVNFNCHKSTMQKEVNASLPILDLINMNHSTKINPSTSKEELKSLYDGLKFKNETYVLWEIRQFPDLSNVYTIEFKKDSFNLKIKRFYTSNRMPFSIDSVYTNFNGYLPYDLQFEILEAINSAYFWNLLNYENQLFGCVHCNFYFMEGTRDSIDFPTKNFNSFVSIGLKGSLLDLVHKIKSLENNAIKQEK